MDAEHALDPTLAESIGVKTENLLLSQPDCGEQALSLVDTLVRSGSVDVVVVDSVGREFSWHFICLNTCCCQFARKLIYISNSANAVSCPNQAKFG